MCEYPVYEFRPNIGHLFQGQRNDASLVVPDLNSIENTSVKGIC